MADKSTDVLIIGGGVAGMTVALYLARAGHKPMLITEDDLGGNLNEIDTIQNFVGVYDQKASIIRGNIMLQLYQAGLDETNLFQGHTATGIKKQGGRYIVEVEDDTFETYTIDARFVVLATGQQNLKLPNLPEDVEQHSCVLCDGFMFKDEDVVVIGGGNSALTEAIELAKTSKTVYLVTRRPEFRAEKILQERIKEYDNIKHSVGNLKSVEGNKYIFDTHSLIADGLFVYIGSKPNTEPFKDLMMVDSEGYVDTFDHYVSVEVPNSQHIELTTNLFAVGDVSNDQEAKQFGIAIGQATEVAIKLIKKLS